MPSNAVCTWATRAVPRTHRIEPVGLDLTGPSRECPFAFDDDPGAACAPLEDLSVSGVEVPTTLPSQPVGTTSSKQDRFREEARSALQSLSVSIVLRSWGGTEL